VSQKYTIPGDFVNRRFELCPCRRLCCARHRLSAYQADLTPLALDFELRHFDGRSDKIRPTGCQYLFSLRLGFGHHAANDSGCSDSYDCLDAGVPHVRAFSSRNEMLRKPPQGLCTKSIVRL
jgi:hypothetical protein